MITVTMRGIKETIAHLKRIESATEHEKIIRLIEQVALDLQKWAWSDCPVDTGLLRGSISVARTDKGYKVYVDDVYYAEYVHDGTRWMPPRPFLLGANAQRAKKELLNKLRKYVKEEVNK